MINTSPEPVTNWTASVTEDLAVFGGLWAAFNYPIAFLIGLVLFVALVVWLLPKIWRGVKKVFTFLAGLFGHKPENVHIDEGGALPHRKH